MTLTILEAAFPPNPARVKCHIPRFRGDGSGRDFYVADAQHKINTIPRTSYRRTFHPPRKRTKEINFPVRPPRYVMDGSGRDSFVFLHGDIGKPPKSLFRKNSTPWGENSSCPYAFDPHLKHEAKCLSLRRKIPTQPSKCSGLKIVTKNPHRRYKTPAFNTQYLTSRKKNDIRRARRQMKSVNRLSTPNPRLVMQSKTTKRPKSASHTSPWVGNSRRPARPATVGASEGKRMPFITSIFTNIDGSLLD